MAPPDFARRINYSREAVHQFLNGNYSRISSNDGNIRAAIRDFIAGHPIATPIVTSGRLYETENVRLLRRYFHEALDHRRAYYLYGAPGTQKTYVLQHLIAELNRSEIGKNAEGRRAYYIYVRQGIRSLDLMKRVAESCGAIGLGTVDRILRNLRFDLSQRKVLLVFDEAQHLSIECLETIRELLDLPPHCGCCSPAPTNWKTSLLVRLLSWNNGARGFMPVRRCLASPKTRQLKSCTPN
jgi:DNA transposition AAA+ family ATPase